tara:strand:- start:684 stop:1973 length:1290 start_codon:yes stop_codon:yes gene_type:complete
MKILFSNWSRNKFIKRKIFFLKTLKTHVKKKITIIGNNLSYSDASISTDNNKILSLKKIKKKMVYDKDDKVLTCSSNCTLYEINKFLKKYERTLFTVAGHPNVTIGGAISANIHGKNSFKFGAFGTYVNSVKLKHKKKNFLVSKRKNKQLFDLIVSGSYGLTGIIVEASIKTMQIKSNQLITSIVLVKSIEEMIKQFDKNETTSDYMICRIFLISKNKIKGSFHNSKFLNKNIKIYNFFNFNKNFFLFFSKFFFRKNIIKLFYFLIPIFEKKIKQDLEQIVFPFKNYQNYNLLFGNNGFYQFQVSIKRENFKIFFKNFSKLILKYDIFSPLITIKKIKKNKNDKFLSFMQDGYTIAIDLFEKDALKLKNDFYNLTINSGGKVYLAKDMLLEKDDFKKIFNIKKFNIICKNNHIIGCYKNDMSRRLSITE